MTTAARPAIRVGIIGASADPWAWAATAHVPALRSLPEYKLVAVASRNQANAQAAARYHGIPDAHGDYREMIGRDDLDMICISTSSEHHFDLVMPAIASGKHVFCEWPFGTDLAQAITMRDAARARGVRTLVGLQTRYSPLVAYVHDLIVEGFIGTLWSANFARANDQTARKPLTAAYLAFLEAADGGLRIMGGHGFDTLAAYVGEFVDLQAYFERQMKQARLATGELAEVRHKDHLLVQGRLAGGAVVSVMMKQNSPTLKPFHLELSGSSGALVITTDKDLHFGARHPGNPSDYVLTGTASLDRPFARMAIPGRYRLVPPETPSGQPVDVAHMYRHFAQALHEGTPCRTDFEHGVRRHRLLAAIVRAAATGQRSDYRPDKDH